VVMFTRIVEIGVGVEVVVGPERRRRDGLGLNARILRQSACWSIVSLFEVGDPQCDGDHLGPARMGMIL